jgi:putative membrane protein
MTCYQWILSEWSSYLRTPKALLTMIGILLIPALYSGIYLWAFWDPYERVEQLSVAVVNEDKPQQYNGQTVRIGEELVEELKKDPAFQWSFVSREQADEGFMNNKYYFQIRIPEDFSLRATTLISQQPTPLELDIIRNEGLNYTVGAIGQTAVEKIRQQLAKRLTETYTEIIFDRIEDLHAGMEEAGSGAEKLLNGIKDAAEGTQALQDAITKGTPSVNQLHQGAVQLDEASARLSEGTTRLKSGAAELAKGMEQVGEGMKELSDGSTTLGQGLGQSESSAKQLDELIAKYMEAHPDAAADANLMLLAGYGKQLSAAMTQLADAVERLSHGMAQARVGQSRLSDGASQLAEKMAEASVGASSIHQGVSKIAEGANRFRGSWADLLNGTTRLAEGEQKLLQGGGELQLALVDGAERLDSIHASQDLYQMMANPVRLREQSIHALPNYGTGMAPFFISVSLFVGALLLSTIFPLRNTATPPPSAWMWFLSKFGVLTFVSLGQTIIASFILVAAVGLQPLNTLTFGLYSFYCSLVFMAIIQLLVTAGDNVGRFIGVALLVLQLTATSGTYPVELVPDLLQYIHRFLPITYTVEGFRSIISTGDYRLAYRDMLALLIFMLPAALLTVLLMKRLLKQQGTRLEPKEI